MEKRSTVLLMVTAVAFLLCNQPSTAQEIKIKKSQSWEMSGRVQMQYMFNTSLDSDGSRTTNGFRMRRGRFQVKGKVTDFVETNFQAELRDNSPSIKDLQATLLLPNQWYVSFGQFKVPVWREEFIRSSGDLVLVERSAAANFLIANQLSARQVGVELGKGSKKGKLHFAVNFSNGAGEGGREDGGRPEDSRFVNDGKMVAGRLNFAAGKNIQIGVSGVWNNTGSNISGEDNRGSNTAIAPDFGVYLPAGEKGTFDIEGGLAIGSLNSGLFSSVTDNLSYAVADVSARLKTKTAKVNESFAGFDMWELAAGFSYIEPNSDVTDDESFVVRFGPALYFGKQTRIQINGEIESFSDSATDSQFRIRSQATFNF